VVLHQAGTFTVTTSGNYTITVKMLIIVLISNVITVAPQLTLNAILNKDITCNPAPTDAQITLTPTGGVGPFTYTQRGFRSISMASNILQQIPW
jgi:hypothetical protein